MGLNDSPVSDLGTPTRVRYGVLAFACTLSMITYLDRVCFGTVAGYVQTEFRLSDSEKGLLFTAFALAYALFEVPSGWLGDVFGPRKTLIRIVLWWSFFTAVTGLIYPEMLGLGVAFAAMLAVRFLFGMGEAGAYPNLARALHNWFPFQERGFAQGMVWMAGRLAGGFTPFLVLALLIERPTAHGDPTTMWRHIFWIFGGLGVVWCAIFWLWFRDRPEQMPSVNAAERALIAGPTPEPDVSHSGGPWRHFLLSGNLWVLCLMYFCTAYGWYFNITWLPDYLREQFGLDRGSRWSAAFWKFSLLAGAPLLLGSLACVVGGFLTDEFIRRTGNRKWGRRFFGVLGHGLCSSLYLSSLFVGDVWLFVAVISLATFFNDLTMGSAWASCLDIGRKYSGMVAGCMNMVGNLGGAAAGYITGWVLDYSAHLVEPGADAKAFGWRVNFLIFASVYALATALWLRFDSTKPVIPEEGAA
ncbi:MAG: MFS transporter [Gemmataceae bacterium]|nr:MFS transporter [Gemmataceae bacterium]MDW8264872.1 MFS transporter [Gemmataceae bacterium]